MLLNFACVFFGSGFLLICLTGYIVIIEMLRKNNWADYYERQRRKKHDKAIVLMAHIIGAVFFGSGFLLLAH